MSTILVIDDEEDIRSIVKHHLVKAGYKVVEAEDGEQAIQKINEGDNPLTIDAAICDIRPECQTVQLAVLFRVFEAFDRLIKSIHVGEHVCPAHAGGGRGYGIVTADLCGLIVEKRFVVSIQAVVEIP